MSEGSCIGDCKSPTFAKMYWLCISVSASRIFNVVDNAFQFTNQFSKHIQIVLTGISSKAWRHVESRISSTVEHCHWSSLAAHGCPRSLLKRRQRPERSLLQRLSPIILAMTPKGNTSQSWNQMHSVEHHHVNIHFVATRWGNEWGILLGIGGCKTLRFANICWHVRT